MIPYLIQSLLWQVSFLLFYILFLKKETFFRINRIFLIGGLVLSYLFPLIHLPVKIFANNVFYAKLEPVILESRNLQNHWEQQDFLNIHILWITGSIIVFLFTLFNLYKIYKLYQKHGKQNIENAILIKVPGLNNAFTFFHLIFIEHNLQLSVQEKIITHEKIHVNEKHSLDLLIIQLLKMAFWFNPALYFYEKQIKEIHEYIADAAVIKQYDKKEYLNLLLQHRFRNYELTFVQTFFQKSILKKRIKMQNKQKSPKINYLKYTGIIAVVFGLTLFINACSKETPEVKNQPEPAVKQIQETIPEEDVEVAFQFIKNPPQIEGCEGLEGEAAKKCFSEKIAGHIRSTFNTSLADEVELVNPRVKILTQFTIDEEGKITNIKARSRYKILEEEAKRSIATLPRMKPGKQNGKPVKVTYTLPIIFNVEK